MTPCEPSRQVRKTRAALLDAFRDLVLTRRYADIRVQDVIRRADVGRSTFYEHFRDKDDLLRESLSPILTVLADTVGVGDCQRLPHVLEHFRENSRLARGLANGPSAAQVVAVLAALIRDRLVGLGWSGSLPVELAAAQLAEGQLGLLRAWLNGGAVCPAETMAEAMHTSTLAAARALAGSP